MVWKPKKLSSIPQPSEDEVLDESQEMEDEEQEEEEPQVQEQPKQVKKVASAPVKPVITVNDVLLDHEERLKELEATIYRLKNI